MPLYFDTYTQKFCVESNSNAKLICSDIVENTRKAGKNAPSIICGDGKIELQIDAYFDSNNEQRSYIRAKVFIDGVLMLPISRYFNSQRRNPVNNPIHNINYYTHWYHPGPYTIVQHPLCCDNNGDNDVFPAICEICNNATTWIQDETQRLATSYFLYSKHNKNHLENPFRLAGSITLARLYEKVIDIHDFCGFAFDDDCLNVMHYLFDTILQEQNKSKASQHRIELYDVIWNYVKDYIV